MEDGSVAILVDAKEEYTKQLISILKTFIYQGIKSIYLDAKDICNQDNTPEKVLMVFQELLSRIPKWSQDIINKEFDRIVTVSKCDYIEDLLKVVYVSHIKILTIVHSATKNKKLSIKVPNGGHFIHLCYIECAREFWKDPFLFSENVNKYELQKNMRDSENMIAECIIETIRKQLPVRHILKEFLNEPDEEIEEEEDVKEPMNKKYLKKLESVVKKELKTTKQDTNGIIDIDLIKKVIKEEFESGAHSNVVKKEFIDTVIDKIIEQAQSTPNDNTSSTTITTPIQEPKLEPKLEPNPEPKLEPKLESDSKSNKKIESNLEEKQEEEKKQEEKKQEEKIKDKNIVKIDDDLPSSQSLEQLLEDLPINEKLENKKEEENTSDDIVINEPITKVNNNAKIQINNIEEINLNLDELDDNDIVNLSDNELESVDISNKNVITNSNTKHIFFKD